MCLRDLRAFLRRNVTVTLITLDSPVDADDQTHEILAHAGTTSRDVLLRRALIVHEDVETLGIGAELSAVIVEERFDRLDAPVLRVTYPDTHCPFSNVLEQANMPDANKIVDALRRLSAY